ncbi:MAG: hypothetical protein J7497_03275 [Chitinophagaceae bacterium]|nr:hypothetical protein [Chitinophagaceae bacterium]
MLAENYKGYKGLPELVGLLTMKESMSKGLTVAESVARLKRFHWMAKRLSLIFTARITSMPIYELKMAFGLHAHYLAEHAEQFFNRVREMREPPYGMDTAPHPALDIFLDELQSAPDNEFVTGVYTVAIPELLNALSKYLTECNKLFEHPTYRVCRFAALEVEEINTYGKEAVKVVNSENKQWLQLLKDCLNVMGGPDGSGRSKEVLPERNFSKQPYQYKGFPKRDERFKDVYNMGVNAEALLLNKEIAPLPKTLMLYFKRMREIDVPEMMASIISETPDKPWAYYKDMIRQLWDESRHAMMGEVGFTSLNIKWEDIPFNLTWSYLLNTKMTNIERHAILYFIEQGLMPAKTGKQYEWEVALKTDSHLTELIQDYDWADEVLHARIGRDWIVSELGGQLAAMDFGNKAWSKALSDSFETFEKEGLTKHENWWPGIYKKACEFWNITPDPAILNYNTSYRESRPDRVELTSD